MEILLVGLCLIVLVPFGVMIWFFGGLNRTCPNCRQPVKLGAERCERCTWQLKK
jgi:predicted amidophosphoribosyltransferase